MKFLLLLSMLVPSLSSAGLYCADSNFGAPSQIPTGYQAYAFAQVDYMGPGDLQIDIEHIYYGKNEVVRASLTVDSGKVVRGLAEGKYTDSRGREFFLESTEGGITLTSDNNKFICE